MDIVGIARKVPIPPRSANEDHLYRIRAGDDRRR
jgi:hypothetical protein